MKKIRRKEKEISVEIKFRCRVPLFRKRSCWRLQAAHRQLHSTESSPAEPATAKYFKSSRLTKNDDKFWHLLRISVFGVTWQILNWRRWLMYDWNEKKKMKWNSQLFLSKDVLLSSFCFKDSVLEFVRVARFSISTYAMMELLVLPLSSTFTRKISIVFYRICSTRLVYLKYAWFKSFCNSNFRSTACSLHNTVNSTLVLRTDKWFGLWRAQHTTTEKATLRSVERIRVRGNRASRKGKRGSPRGNRASRQGKRGSPCTTQGSCFHHKVRNDRAWTFDNGSKQDMDKFWKPGDAWMFEHVA